MPIFSPDWTVKVKSCKTLGPSGEYLADNFSIDKVPLVGQDAAGSPDAVAGSSCSMLMDCWIRSRLDLRYQ